MSFETAFTKDNLDLMLKELGKEFRRLNGTKMPAEIILLGGASILANYGFRAMTYDMDAIITASSVMKDAINRVGDKHGLPNGWLNADCMRTTSYSPRLLEVSVYYKTFSNILTVRTVAAEYLVATKLMSGRRYKNDLSDVAGILWEHEKRGASITRDAVDTALKRLYGGWEQVPARSIEFFDMALDSGDYEALYQQRKKREHETKEELLEVERASPGLLREGNLDAVLEAARPKRKKNQRER